MLLDALDAAPSLTPLRKLQAVRLHSLSGSRKGVWAMTVNARCSLTFDSQTVTRTLSRLRTITGDEPRGGEHGENTGASR